MKSILMSFKPQTVARILTGKQTIIIAKSTPKEVPFKVYIYCTSVKQMKLSDYTILHRDTDGMVDYWHGKVVAEFVCSGVSEYITEFSKDDNDYQDIKQIWRDEDDMPGEISYATTIISNCYDNPNDCILLERANMSFDDVRKYCNYKDTTIYGIHITDLKIYDEPKELDNFTGVCKTSKRCGESKICSSSQKCLYDKLTKPPATWMYVNIFKPN